MMTKQREILDALTVNPDEGSLNLIARKHSNGTGPTILTGQRVSVQSILNRIACGESIPMIAESVGLSLEDILKAVRYASTRLGRDTANGSDRAKTGVEGIIGKWPGDENDEEILKALETMS